MQRDLGLVHADSRECRSFALTSIRNDEIVQWFRIVPTLPSSLGAPEEKTARSERLKQIVNITPLDACSWL
jgi:hypothetical protein